MRISLSSALTAGTLTIENVSLSLAPDATKYYFVGAQRIAMRTYVNGNYSDPMYFSSDHLGSTSLTTDAAGNKVSELHYKPWGEVRTATTTGASLPTAYTYTGQFSYMDDPTTAGVEEGFGLMFYNARWYDPALGRFNQPDTIVPEQTQGVQAWDRYAYVNNNPVRYNDPSGHFTCQNNSKTFKGDCQKIIEQWLIILQTKGGKEGEDLVKAFRSADQRTHCFDGLCATDTDLITITINDGGELQYGTNGQEEKDNNFNMPSSIMHEIDADNVADLDIVGAFGHEIDHLAHGSGGLNDEVRAFAQQYQLYENMGIQDENLPFVNAARIVKDYENASNYDIMTSNWATQKYSGMPLYQICWGRCDTMLRDFTTWTHNLFK